MSFKRIYAMLAAGIMLSACVLSACGEESSPDIAASTTAAETSAPETEELSEVELRAQVSDDLPEADFDGYTFRVVIENYIGDWYDIPELTGDIVDDAVYKRNLAVSERFNIKYEYISPGDYTAVGNWMQKTVLAAEDAFDLGIHHVVNASKVVLKGVFLDWYQVPHIDLTKPWWNRSNIEDLTYAGVAPIVIGDYVLNAVSGTYCMFYDKVVADSYGISDMYGTVNDGKWTIDLMSALTENVYTDLNGDNQRSRDDYYGFATGAASNIGAYLWAFNNPVCTKNSDGTISVTIKSDKMNQIVEKLNKICWENTGTYYAPGGDDHHNGGINMFRENKAMFANGGIGSAVALRDFEHDFGIIPYPKWDEQQVDYRELVDGSHCCELIPITTTDLERSGVIIEALNAESYKQVIPVYFETALKVKYSRDNESVQILDMLLANRFFDFGYVYDGWEGASFWLEGLVQKHNSDFESFYAKNEKKMNKHYDKVFAYLEELAAAQG